MIDFSVLSRIEDKLHSMFSNSRHVEEASNGIFMACIRNNIDPNELLDRIEDQTIFDLTSFKTQHKGNIYNFISKDFQKISKNLINITAGGNGGMASIGRGEFLFCFLSNLEIKLSKSGKGDLEYLIDVFKKIIEEVKYNGGKIEVFAQAGSDTNKKLNDIVGKKIDYIPFRKSDRKIYTKDRIEELNGLYWEALSGSNQGKMNDEQLKLIMMKTAFDKVFLVSDRIIIIDEDGSFVRFDNSKDAHSYYETRIENTSFEIRANQKNPCAMYLHTLG